MSQNGTKSDSFPWNSQREEVAEMVASGRVTDEEIAGRSGISRRQLDRWKNHPIFAARVDEIVEAYRKRILKKALAIKECRIDTYIRDFEATEAILRERGERMADDPSGMGGESTGYIVRDYKGKDADVPVYAFDQALFRERRAIREQIADELGQLVRRTEWTGKDGGPMSVVVEYVTEPPKS